MNEFIIPNNAQDFVNILNELNDEGKVVILKKFIDEFHSFSVKCEAVNKFTRVINCYVNFVIRPYFDSEKSYNTYKIKLVTFGEMKVNYYVHDFVSIINEIQDYGELFIVNESEVEETINTFEVKEKATMLEVITGDHVGGRKTRIFDFRTMEEK
ncbi:MAG: hypothetical protein RBT49_08500 [Bacteroidales bacterium]|jgi:hypothetical protein|nr:hypothetical protein [Bacteroidales bacterium]